MLNAWTGTVLAVMVMAAGFHALKLGTAANASTAPDSAPVEIAAWGPPMPAPDAAVPPAAKGKARVLEALAERTRWVLVNRLTDARCTFTRRALRTSRAEGPLLAAHVRLDPACADAMRDAHRVRGWRVDRAGGAAGGRPRVTMVDELGSQVMEFAWNEETGLASTTGPWRALALVPVTAETR